MSLLEEKYMYYDEYYSYYGLPKGWNTLNFFDNDFLNYIINANLQNYSFRDLDIEKLLQVNGNLTPIQEKLLSIICTKNTSDFNFITINKAIGNETESKKFFIEALVKIINSNENIKVTILQILNNDTELIDILCTYNITNIEFCQDLITLFALKKINLLKLLKNQTFQNILFNLPIIKFIDLLERTNAIDELTDLITLKIETLNYSEIILLLKNKYNVSENKPEYLSSLYEEYKDELVKERIKDILSGIDESSSQDIIETAKKLIETEKGKEVLLSRFLDPKFSQIVNILNLEDSLKLERKFILKKILTNYQFYTLDTIKAVFCAFHFELSINNTILNLKTILEYSENDEKAKELVKDNYNEIKLIYNFLNSSEFDISLENILISANINLNEILEKFYNLFKQNLIQEITIKKNVTNKKIVNLTNGANVEIYTLDNNISENDKFLIHSMSISNENSQNIKKSYLRNAQSHEKICLSLLGKNRYKTFVGGIVFGYTNIDKFNLYSATISDGQTNQSHSNEKVRRSNLLPINKFLSRTNPKSYNEINFLTPIDNIMLPDYILSINKEPTDIEIEVAAQFNIPIYVYYVKEKDNLIEEVYEENKNENWFDSITTIEIVPSVLRKSELELDNIQSEKSFKV